PLPRLCARLLIGGLTHLTRGALLLGPKFRLHAQGLRSRMRRSSGTAIVFGLILAALCPRSADAQSPFRKIGEMEVSLVGITTSIDPANPVVPKNTASGVRVVVKAGEHVLSAAEIKEFIGASFTVQGLLRGPGFANTRELPITDPGQPQTTDPL